MPLNYSARRTRTSLCLSWLCNEAPNLFPEIALGTMVPSAIGRFLLSLNGSPVAWSTHTAPPSNG
jgi:hypothetical protein